MGPFEAFLATARTGLSSIEAALALLASARDSYGDAHAQLSGLAGESNNSRLDAATRELQAALDLLDAAEIGTHNGTDTFGEYLTRIGAESAQVGTGAPGGIAYEVIAPADPLSPFRAELTGHDEDDETKGRFRRTGRAFVRTAGDMKEAGQAFTKPSAASDQDGFAPPPPGTTYQTVQHRHDPPSISAWNKAPDPADIVGNAIIVGVVALEALSRVKRGKRDKA